MRLCSVWLPALAISASLSVGTASATCVQGCIDQYEECSSSCSQCFCQDDYNACTAYCETSDWDEDGITEPNDNCPDDYNPNQADCDSDGAGDVCDPDDANWVEIENIGPCDWDGDLYFDAVVVEIYSAKRWRNTCNNAECTDVYRSSSRWCEHFSSGCGFSATNCCDCRYGNDYCDHLEGCPAQNCPFDEEP